MPWLRFLPTAKWDRERLDGNSTMSSCLELQGRQAARVCVIGVARQRYSHPPLRFSTGRIRMNASTAWIRPS